jgi:hypothetical protein
MSGNHSTGVQPFSSTFSILPDGEVGTYEINFGDPARGIGAVTDINKRPTEWDRQQNWLFTFRKA